MSDKFGVGINEQIGWHHVLLLGPKMYIVGQILYCLAHKNKRLSLLSRKGCCCEAQIAKQEVSMIQQFGVMWMWQMAMHSQTGRWNQAIEWLDKRTGGR